MRSRYAVYLALILLLGAFACYQIATTPMGSNPRVASVVQVAAVTIALFSAVTALARTETRPIRVKVKVERGPREEGSCTKKGLAGKALAKFEAFPSEIKSRAVGFRIRNTSGFTLQRPAIRFGLDSKYAQPIRHPGEPGFDENDQSKRNYWGFNAGTPGWTTDCRCAEYGESVTLSLVDLAPINNGQEIPVWIRMVDRPERADFSITVSVSAENAEGWTKDVTVPKEVFSSPPNPNA